eukprot:TRINITY_DN2308_c0_g2_i1.p1 TRINITY_DN2308_c0_g2~~TRINITY_DN2308_c0_g2_i1.p1  ORF type:complete len:734 (+),score=279.98 TRINITY_DN2308_c0_g2_i1:272-2203(+)
MNEGLTMVVGPPGTGKTDVAVQTISNWYHNFPEQRTLLVTHSNQALNQLFGKIMALDIDERHLLRLGHGQGMLDTEKDFSKNGRVNFMLKRRLDLLSEVYRLGNAIGVTEDYGTNCEIAAHFFQLQVVPRWKAFTNAIKEAQEKMADGEELKKVVFDKFPFFPFFFPSHAKSQEILQNKAKTQAEAQQAQPEHEALQVLRQRLGDHLVGDARQKVEAYQPLPAESQEDAYIRSHQAASYFTTTDGSEVSIAGESFQADIDIAEKCWRILENIFGELEECRAFELLISSYDRSNYLLTKQARIVAMTCTHAALKRKDLVELGFKYDNILMEETAQILEIETFIPLLLQNQPKHEQCRLKRVVLIGDHNQLPPVVKNIAFQKFGHLDQSLFSRFVRLGVPTVDLDFQGRARPSLASLYSWKYHNLKNLPTVTTGNEFQLANAGFEFDYQMIDVQDYQGKGEFEPNQYFYQNLGEAEYIVAVYQYMRLLGYPAEKITILSTYNGQKHLIRDVIEQKCARTSFGRPLKITTVDRYQGQQNDYILLSLVRTKNVGHIRDQRRLIVAMSRARLGLFVFGRKSLFENCFELRESMKLLVQRPHQLSLVSDEKHPTDRKNGAALKKKSTTVVKDVKHMMKIVAQKIKSDQQ